MNNCLDIPLGINKGKKSFKPSFKKKEKLTRSTSTTSTFQQPKASNKEATKPKDVLDEPTHNISVPNDQDLQQASNSLHTPSKTGKLEQKYKKDPLIVNNNRSLESITHEDEQETVENSTKKLKPSTKSLNPNTTNDNPVSHQSKQADCIENVPNNSILVDVEQSHTELKTYGSGYTAKNNVNGLKEIINIEPTPKNTYTDGCEAESISKNKKVIVSGLPESIETDNEKILKRINKLIKPTPKVYVQEGLESPSSRKRKLQELYEAETSNHGEPKAKSLNVAAPQVKVVNGEIQLDLDSLVVDRANEDYQLFNNETVVTRKKSRYAKPDPAYKKQWTDLETQVFYDGLYLYGLDFEKIAETLPQKDRTRVKNKYKSEDKKYPEKIQYYLFEKRMKELNEAQQDSLNP